MTLTEGLRGLKLLHETHLQMLSQFLPKDDRRAAQAARDMVRLLTERMDEAVKMVEGDLKHHAIREARSTVREVKPNMAHSVSPPPPVAQTLKKIRTVVAVPNAEYQNAVLDFLRDNPDSMGKEVVAGMAKIHAIGQVSTYWTLNYLKRLGKVNAQRDAFIRNAKRYRLASDVPKYDALRHDVVIG